jgi:hypothetical protein
MTAIRRWQGQLCVAATTHVDDNAGPLSLPAERTLIRISSRKRRRSSGICCSDVETSCRQIEKASIVRQVGQFAKSMHFTSARNTHHKRQYRESGFVLVPLAVPSRPARPRSGLGQKCLKFEPIMRDADR